MSYNEIVRMSKVIVVGLFVGLFSSVSFGQELKYLNFFAFGDGVDDRKGMAVLYYEFSQELSYSIRLEFKNEKVVYVPRKISGTSKEKLESWYWDGKDGSGKVVPVGALVKVTVKGLERQKVYQVPFELYSVDADGDGVKNQWDLDADNDGISSELEYGGELPFADHNNNGIPNYLDIDFIAQKSIVYQDQNKDGINDYFDSDLDHLLNDLDLDGNADGIPDIAHVDLLDRDGNGRYDAFIDLDTNGISDDSIIAMIRIADHDRDKIPDFLDRDADNDGLGNNLEAQELTVLVIPEGGDSDQDGLIDLYDVDAGGQVLKMLDGNKNGIADLFEAYGDGISFGNKVCYAEYQIKNTAKFENSNSVIPEKKCITVSIENVVDVKEKKVALEWHMGDGITLEGRTVKHCYESTGLYAVQLNIVDPTDNTLIQSEELELDVATLDRMELKLQTPDQISVNQRFKLDFSVNTFPGFEVKAVYWDFGDGNYDCLFDGEYVYSLEGEYNLKVFVIVSSRSGEYYLSNGQTIKVVKK